MIFRAPDFEKRGVKLIGISANGLADHEKWVKDINDWGSQFGPTDVQYPIVSTHTPQIPAICVHADICSWADPG